LLHHLLKYLLVTEYVLNTIDKPSKMLAGKYVKLLSPFRAKNISTIPITKLICPMINIKFLFFIDYSINYFDELKKIITSTK